MSLKGEPLSSSGLGGAIEIAGMNDSKSADVSMTPSIYFEWMGPCLIGKLLQA